MVQVAIVATAHCVRKYEPTLFYGMVQGRFHLRLALPVVTHTTQHGLLISCEIMRMVVVFALAAIAACVRLSNMAPVS